MKTYQGSRLLFHAIEDLRFESEFQFHADKQDSVFQIIGTTICGSDLRIIRNGDPRIFGPRVLGHEIVARVVQPGTRSDLKNAEVVSIGADCPCGSCKYCISKRENLCERHLAIGYQLDGGLASYLVLPSRIVDTVPIVEVRPKNLVLPYALSEPVGCVLHGLEYSRVEFSQRVLIIGGGPIGIMLARLATEYCGVATSQIVLLETSQNRRDFACELGLNVIEPIDENAELGQFDQIFTATSNPNSHVGILKYVAKGGSLNFFGGVPKDSPSLLVHSNDLHYSEITISGSHGSAPKHHALAATIIANDETFWSRLITSTLKLENFSDALSKLNQGLEMKVAVTPNVN